MTHFLEDFVFEFRAARSWRRVRRLKNRECSPGVTWYRKETGAQPQRSRSRPRFSVLTGAPMADPTATQIKLATAKQKKDTADHAFKQGDVRAGELAFPDNSPAIDPMSYFKPLLLIMR